MKKSKFLYIALSLVIITSSGSGLVAAKEKPSSDAAINIINVFTDFNTGLLTIAGQNIPTNTVLTVELGGSPMSLASVTSDTIVAALPPNFPDGDYLLTVNDGKSYDEYDLTIKDTAGLQSQIDPCAAGYAIREILADGSVVCDSFLKATSSSTITIESTSGDVTIVAGATSVTVEPNGRVTIEGETLNLRGTDINMKASNQITMDAGSKINMKAGANSIKMDPASINVNSSGSLGIDASGSLDIGSNGHMDLKAVGIMDLEGAQINLN
jgi:hypothetical protein